MSRAAGELGVLGGFVARVRARPLDVVVLDPSPEVLARREAGRAKRGYGDWAVDELVAGLRRETPHLGAWIDSSGQTPAETTDAVYAALLAGAARVADL